jgi:LmbE family N-acetylglucosaminyl deacetylase
MTSAAVRRALTTALACALAGAAVPGTATMVQAQDRGAAALDQLVRGLGVTARVLVIGAHPDDEDTQFLAWLARGHQVHVAYLSLTRGDGGQNLIGNELGEALGAIRTEEMLAARELDGAQQFFARAYDFGFSKDAAETFTHWEREALTAEVVQVIRAYRPHVVVAIWSGTRADGHGHHEAAGLLARDGFDAAADGVRFPAAIHGEPWMPHKFYRGAWATRSIEPTLTFDVGTYDPVRGESPAELAARSRAQHRSQGQGGLERRGVVLSRLAREVTRVNAGTVATEEGSLFDGIDTSLLRLGPAGSPARELFTQLQAQIAWIQGNLDLRRPHLVVDSLARLVWSITNVSRLLESAPPTLDVQPSLERMRARAQRALLEAAGIAIEVTAPQELLAFNESMPAHVSVHNRGKAPVVIRGAHLTGSDLAPDLDLTLLPDSSVRLDFRVSGLLDHRPWWIGRRVGAMFPERRSPADGIARVAGEGAVSLPGAAVPEEVRAISETRVTLTIAGVTTTVSAGPVMHRVADPVLGERWRPAGGVAPITLEVDRGLEWVRADQPVDLRIRVTIRSHASVARRIVFAYLLPEGISIADRSDSITLAPREVREVFLQLRGRLREGRHEFGVGAVSEGVTYIDGFRTIAYEHIRTLRLYRTSALHLQSVPVTVPRSLTVAYVTGVSDLIAPALRSLGIPTTILTAAELPLLDLARYTTVVIGPRAYESTPELAQQNARLMAWVAQGGTLVVQYGQFEMANPGMLPYPIGFTRPAARVTLEGAEVRILQQGSRLLTWPNRIGASDWEEWVQERGLYMPTTIDPRYRTPLAMNDPNEPENRGAILDAPIGRGRFVYTSLSLFRQVPAGVPGAMRLLVNLLSAGVPVQ